MPEFELFKERSEDPTGTNPLVYRERAYAVQPGCTDADAEVLLWMRFNEVSGELDERPAGKFVQLAVFDHAFTDKPKRPPIATLAWKDWRGEPVVQFPLSARRARAAAPDAAPTATVAPASAGVEQAAPVVSAATAAGAPARPTPATSEPPRKDSSAAIRAVKRSVPPGRRRAGDDLIGELFEAMHELRFVPDVVGGCEFVVAVLEQTLPSEGMLVHVFDINSRNFVVVRARGPGHADALLHRTPDTDAFFRASMRQSRPKQFDADLPAHYANGAWKALGVSVKRAAFGPAVQGGRYLGLIELANPAGDVALHPSEINALEYICEQFAEFLAGRPIIIDAEAVLPKS